MALVFLVLGGFQGEIKFQLIYSSGGAIDASVALREVNNICESYLSFECERHAPLLLLVHRQNEGAPPYVSSGEVASTIA